MLCLLNVASAALLRRGLGVHLAQELHGPTFATYFANGAPCRANCVRELMLAQCNGSRDDAPWLVSGVRVSRKAFFADSAVPVMKQLEEQMIRACS